MTTKQKILKFFYPFLHLVTKLSGTNYKTLKSTDMARESFYFLKTKLNNGSDLNFESFKNKKVMLVNTASDCGYTKQYEDLQKLYEQHKEKLVIIGFPANDFGEQEKENDDTIASFCKVNYGVTFPMAKKSQVILSATQNEVYKWLTDETKNGWNNVAPSWNFCKYLVDENGNLTNFFEASVEPMSKDIAEAINN